MPYAAPPELRNLSLSDIAKLSQERKLPPVHAWNPVNISDSKMRILSDGRWLHDGGEIKRTAMIRAFASLLRKDDDGYWLVTPYEKQSIIVDDAPFMAVEINSIGKSKQRQITIRTNTGEIMALGSEHQIILQSLSGDDPLPYIHVRDGLYAKLTRSMAYELFTWATEESGDDNQKIGIYSGDIFFDLSDAL